MANPTIKYYPVCNGDTVLITLTDDTTFIIDCNIRESSKGTTDPSMFDVKADLVKSLKKDGKILFTDVFILTHGDEDHCLGFENNFYLGDPKNYSDTDARSEKIRIDVLWFSPLALEKGTNDDAKAFRREAKRRIKLHNDNHSDKDIAGNRIVIIGDDGSEELSTLNTVRYVPGQVITRFNNKTRTDFSIFVHSPYKKQLMQNDAEKNHCSIVFQARFIHPLDRSKFTCLAMFGGDADHYAFKNILEQTKKHGNDTKEQALAWDLFLSPHHCSWTFFNDTPQSENPKPVASSTTILGYSRTGARVIASSKAIKNNEDNPPHYQAKQQYVNQVGESNFLNTEVYDVKGKTPQPIVFEVSTQGPMKPKAAEGSNRNAGMAGTSVINSVSSYGSKGL